MTVEGERVSGGINDQETGEQQTLSNAEFTGKLTWRFSMPSNIEGELSTAGI